MLHLSSFSNLEIPTLTLQTLITPLTEGTGTNFVCIEINGLSFGGLGIDIEVILDVIDGDAGSN